VPISSEFILEAKQTHNSRK